MAGQAHSRTRRERLTMFPPVLLFLGYSLVYAAVAAGGKFATDPWNGLFSDAYVDLGGAATGSAAGVALGNAPANVGAPAPTVKVPRPRATIIGSGSGSMVGSGIGAIPSAPPPSSPPVLPGPILTDPHGKVIADPFGIYNG